MRPRRKRNPPHKVWRVVSGRLRQFEVEKLDKAVREQGVTRAEFIARVVRAALECAA